MSRQPLSPDARSALDAGLKSAIEDARTGRPLQAWDINDLSRETEVVRVPFRDQRPWALAILFAVMSPIVALAYELTR